MKSAEQFIMIAAAAVVAAALIGLIAVGCYRAATSPCRCTEQKCWTVQSTSFPDADGRVWPTTEIDCRCLKQWCPAEACP